MRRVPLLGLLVFLAVSPMWGQSPPRDLKLLGDHWTAWDPPAAIEEGAEVYLIQRGDTLWNLAERFYQNPYLWPQIWERNQYIQDAHWIYPGDPLVLGMQVESASVLEQPSTGREAEGDDTEPSDVDTPAAYSQLGSPDDIYCSGYIGPLDEEFDYRIIGSEYEVLAVSRKISKRGELTTTFGAVDTVQVGLLTGDVVYLDGGQAGGLAPGDVFTVLGDGGVVRYPGRRKVVGRYREYLGRVRVLSTQEHTAIAEISQACQPVVVGGVLKPFEPEPIPSERRAPLRPLNEPTSAESLQGAPIILHTKDGVVSVGQDHVVFVELGLADGVEPGDVYTVYRRSPDGRPPVVIGEVAILSVHSLASVAKVIESRFPLYVGDVLERK